MDRIQIFESLLKLLTPGTLLDLGAGHGRFSIAARDLGWNVTAVDARTERLPYTEGITWIHQDVRDFELDRYDLVAVLGLFYHLERADQLSLLDRCSGMTTIIDTHVSPAPLVEDGGFFGRYFEEELSAPTASWKNTASFWPTEDSLFRMLSRTHPTQIKILPDYMSGRSFYIGSPEPEAFWAPLVEAFNGTHAYKLEIQRPNSVHELAPRVRLTEPGIEARLATAQAERDKSDEALRSLRNRKSVRAALAVANRFGPLITWYRGE
jgi:SAM-dependent methyltransferase